MAKSDSFAHEFLVFLPFDCFGVLVIQIFIVKINFQKTGAFKKRLARFLQKCFAKSALFRNFAAFFLQCN